LLPRIVSRPPLRFPFRSPPPTFETDEDRRYFLVRLPLHPRFTTPLNAQATCPPP
jgi:hypothetical protein